MLSSTPKSSRRNEKKVVDNSYITAVILIILTGCFGITLSVIISTIYESTILTNPFASSSSTEEVTSLPLVRDIGGTPVVYPGTTIQTLDSSYDIPSL